MWFIDSVNAFAQLGFTFFGAFCIGWTAATIYNAIKSSKENV